MASTVKPFKNNIKKKKKRCSYSKYCCSRYAIHPLSYCIKHIFEDKNANYKRCSFVYTSINEECTNLVIPGTSAYNYCLEHTQETEVANINSKPKLLPPLPTADTILSDLSHYVCKSDSEDTTDSKSRPNEGEMLNPFENINASKVNGKIRDILNYSGEVDSDAEPVTVDNVWDNADHDSSDCESLDFEMNNPLRHAEVFTDEEMILMLRNEAVRVQNLCILQFRRLLYYLKEKRNKYTMELKREKEIYGPLQMPRQMTQQEKRQFDELKALAKYQKIGTGPEARLFKKMLERRKADRYQVLFQECGVQKGDHTCLEPIIPILSDTCTYHLTLPDDVVMPVKEEMKIDDSETGGSTSEPALDFSSLLNGYPSSKPAPDYEKFLQPSTSSAAMQLVPSTSEMKPAITDDLDIKLTDKLFEDISKKLKHQEPFSELDDSKYNDEDLELKSVVKEISNFFEMNDNLTTVEQVLKIDSSIAMDEVMESADAKLPNGNGDETDEGDIDAV